MGVILLVLTGMMIVLDVKCRAVQFLTVVRKFDFLERKKKQLYFEKTSVDVK